MKVLKFKFDKYRVSEWLWLAVYYFEAARCLAKDDVTWAHNGLASPIVFNMRHGIELFLKAVMLASGDEVVELTHDNHRLFERARQLLKESDDDSVAHAARGLGVSTDEIRKYLDALIWKMEQISRKYTNYTFLPNAVEDPRNELFRYPSNFDGGGNIDLTGDVDLLAGIDAAADAADLSMTAMSFLVMFSKSDSGQHWLEHMAAEEAKRSSNP